MNFGWENHLSDSVSFSVHHIRRHRCQFATQPGDVNFDHLVKMVSARFILYKVILFPLLLISNMWVDALRLERYTFPDDSSPIDGFRFA